MAINEEAALPNELPDHTKRPGAAYRACLIGPDGKIVSQVAIMAETDTNAIQQARTINHGDAVELWDRDRMVFRLARTKREPANPS